MNTAHVNDTTIAYDLVGEGPPILIMHGGLGVDHGILRSAFDPFAGRRRLLYYDHRGNGRSGRPDVSTITMKQLADDGAALLDALGIDRCTVAGHSYGGFVAQEFALRHPSRLDALILLDTTPGQLGAGEAERTEQPVPQPPEEFVGLLSAAPESDEAFAESMAVLAPAYVHRADPDVLRNAVSSTVFSATAMVRGFEVLAQWSAVDRLATISVPTLVCVGRHDVFTSWPQSLRITERIPDARLRIFEDSGHMPWLDEPESFHETVTGFLDEVARRDA